MYWDEAHCNRELKENGTAALFEALDDVTTVFRYVIVSVLAKVAETDDDDVSPTTYTFPLEPICTS